MNPAICSKGIQAMKSKSKKGGADMGAGRDATRKKGPAYYGKAKKRRPRKARKRVREIRYESRYGTALVRG